jgi:hypothetical protein
MTDNLFSQTIVHFCRAPLRCLAIPDSSSPTFSTIIHISLFHVSSVRVQETLCHITVAGTRSLPKMASISMPAAVPAHSSFDTAPDLLLPSKPIHTRRTSRNPKLAPLPAFTFNPGAMDAVGNDHQASSPGAGLGDKIDTNEPVRKSLPPLPAFSFNPGAASQSESGSSSPSHPILEEMAQNTSRCASRPTALPLFSFNPANKDTQTTPSPTKASFIPEPPSSARSAGHRRGASEFIGAGEGAQLSTTPPFSLSPQKTPLGPQVSGHGPPRFSHQHRRSQAVSISEIDTSELIKANAVAKHRAGSMPSSPTDLPSNDHFSRASQSISSLYGRTPPTSPCRRASATGSRPRVGFSDTVDVIPRPLSMISSETEGSTSTVRGNHSLTGSITSISSPAARSTPSPNLEESSPVQRPNTADAASPTPLTSTGMDDSLETFGLPKRPLSAPDSPCYYTNSGGQANKRRFWFSGGGSNEVSPRTTPKHTPTVEETDPMTLLTPFTPIGQMVKAQTRPKTSPERKASIRKRKVRTIAGAIFSRKARSRSTPSRGRRTPTPPLSRSHVSEMTDAVFDEDTTVVIRDTSSHVKDHQRGPILNTDIQPLNQSSDYDSDSDDRVTSPVIDLDAALGPFGSEEKLPQTGFAAARSRMHSSVGRGVPDAFGVMHRRAESAPQMPAMNRSTFGMHRLGSNTNIAEDVFDEEEEDDFLAEESKPRAESDPIASQAAGQVADASKPPDTSNALKNISRASSRSPTGLAISTNLSDSVEIVDAEEDITREAARSSDSTLTAPAMSESEVKQSTPSSITLAYPAPQVSYASSGEGRSAPSSAISSPDADHVNFDSYPRFSRYPGEPSPDAGLRCSTEDVPSLCDSVSTGNAPRFSSGAATRSSAEQHSSSFSAPPTARITKPQQTWKRASLASLNRLIPGSSHGEKSRLRFEESAEHVQEEKARKKGNRISKLMNFWRSKEKENK